MTIPTPEPTTDPTPEARLLGEIEFAIGNHFNEVRNEGEIDEYGLMQSIREHLREMRALDSFAQAVVEREREACAKTAESFFPPAHTYASENADIYHAQDDAQRRIATRIRERRSRHV